jgi:hypothetical protein
MSIFLFYFEVNQKNADWLVYQRNRESVESSFMKESKSGRYMISKTDIVFQKKTQPSYIIHDGVSAERLMNGAIVPKISRGDSAFLSKFIRRRLSVGGIIPHFTFQWVNGEKLQGIELKRHMVEQILIGYLDDNGSLEQDVVYCVNESK